MVTTANSSPHLTEGESVSKLKRKSPTGELAQIMFDEWMRINSGEVGRKFPKKIGGRPSIWWIMAEVAQHELDKQED